MKRADFGRLGFVTQSPQDQFLGGTVRQEVMAAFKKEPDAEARSEQILRHIGLWKYRDVSPYLLSQGQQRRLGVAALMAYPCEVLVCDEPTYAQDRENTIAIMESLCRGAAQRGATMLFSTHDRQLAEDYADKIYTLEGGTLHE
jgi:energy-coupling factor transport system ATP-binding protein